MKMLEFNIETILFNALYYLYDRDGINKIDFDKLYNYEKKYFNF